ncbi:MAG: metallophosphoesterase family protein [Bacteroidota bacterium]
MQITSFQQMINRNKIVAVCFTFMLLYNLSAQVKSPFNKLPVSDTSLNYSFIVSGHFHGASTNVSTYPASTLLANIDTLNALKPSFLISLGDLFLDVNEMYIDHYQKSLFDKLQMPLFNAVGNHDLANGKSYEKTFGKTFYSFTKNSELYIVLNTEINDGTIKGEQLEFLKEVVKSASSEQVKNVFIFSHRPVWAESIKKYKKLFKDNTRSVLGNNFLKDILPLLQKISENKNVHWLSGSMGGGPASFFYDKDAETKITFIQTAIRDLPRDAVLQINVINNIVSFKGISLTAQQLGPIESYNIEYWSKTIPIQEKFNFRLLPYLTIQILKHQFFWIGFISCGILALFFTLIIKQWKKRK